MARKLMSKYAKSVFEVNNDKKKQNISLVGQQRNLILEEDAYIISGTKIFLEVKITEN